MEERWILIGLHETDGIGKKTISKLLSGQHQLTDFLDYKEGDWTAAGLRKDQAVRLTKQFNIDWIEQRQESVYKLGIEVVTYLDHNYPILMKETVQPPWVMYGRGDLNLLHAQSIAMVGTRMPTVYGRKIGEKLAEQLCKAGLTIVSGLARGIDSVCHDATLRANGKTIAVFGTGIDNIYPPENTSLAERIAETGLLLSEYPPGTRARQGLFPERNRIIAGLTLGTLVVEADIRSGSLITADAALEAGRDVFAVPGPITSPKSRGSHNLIRQGAKLVTCATDLLEEFRLDLPNAEQLPYNRGRSAESSETSNEGIFPVVKLSSDEQRVIYLLEQEEQSLDQLVEQLNWDFGHLHSVLLSLIIKKQISQLPGTKYARV
ncbi:DNA-processing protein DprA [Paenibacillus taichungensis]|uniref:DNA-processing protein DprA n=1 Tax=Paenibacillus taichungensis TaxID=484184 RepID=UPI002DBDFC1F|nr:DNA-processing protein DprA [Paenibacillus taichungensis]MEC0109256.1 DNA-processing protein DprA [Paenibacillus taichungensis]MEC0198619.1 DNA-processing protein DprA [Paenibacillus taichungensis]